MHHGGVALTGGLVMVMRRQEQYSRQWVVDLMNRVGFRELADEAARDLPDPVDVHRLEEWCKRHGLSYDDLVSRMGGSP
jgi:hypothetical protein